VVLKGRREVEDVLAGRDRRLMVVVGPCSVHDPAAAGEYATMLREQAERFRDDLLVVMRVYFEKPRSTVGWKGLINDPALDGSGDVGSGLRIARKLLLEIVGRGLPTAVEFLDPITPQYIADTVSWGAIGARTVESQVHRQLASGLSMPIGMKNRPDGSISTAIDAIQAAAASHVFPGIDFGGTPAILHTSGNPDSHLVLRGGGGKPNYSAADVEGALQLLRKSELPERVVIDCSHGNSGKDHMRQPIVAEDVAGQIETGQNGIVGVMLESFLVPGRQDLSGELTYGQSVTDACMGWDMTVEVLERLATAAHSRLTARAQ
jgi:3-deoxy-7-phosphoheptulonate synthase